MSSYFNSGTDIISVLCEYSLTPNLHTLKTPSWCQILQRLQKEVLFYSYAIKSIETMLEKLEDF